MLDIDAARREPATLDLVREACLIESYFAIHTSRLMEMFWDDVDATAALSIEAFEAYVHFATLRKYLDDVNYRPVGDNEIVALREKGKAKPLGSQLEELVNFMATEHFAANFFNDIGASTCEPLLQAIMKRFAPEEDTHSDLAADLISKRISGNPRLHEQVLMHARHFKHIGAYVLSDVSNVRHDNIKSIIEFDRKIESLLGRRLTELETF